MSVELKLDALDWEDSDLAWNLDLVPGCDECENSSDIGENTVI